MKVERLFITEEEVAELNHLVTSFFEPLGYGVFMVEKPMLTGTTKDIFFQLVRKEGNETVAKERDCFHWLELLTVHIPGIIAENECSFEHKLIARKVVCELCDAGFSIHRLSEIILYEAEQSVLAAKTN